ncbi:PDZ domain-containing protein, partial [Microbacterium sp.]|uniref:S41 family peptidase n=1 Tax=Microbacterium sp. TaxID=51671 RepID=UPI0028116324
TADGRIIAASNGGEPNIRHTVVKLLSLDGAWERPQIGMASAIALRADGAIALATPWSRPPAHWKRYRGGTAPRLWLDRTGGGDWERLLPEEAASITDPLWLGDALVFASDRAARFPDRADEQANLWIWDAPGEGEPRLLTRQSAEDGYVRDATTDGERIVWHSRGRIRILDALDAEPRTIDVTLPGARPEPLVLGGSRRLDAFASDHDASGSVVTWRGKAFWLAHREGPARALLADSGVRAREPIVLGRTGFGAVVSDADGEDGIDILSLDGTHAPRRILSGEVGRILHLSATPAGDRIAAISHDGAIRLIEVASGSAREVGRSSRGEARTPRFSPDGRYLVWSQPSSGDGELHALWIADTRGEGAVRLTTGQYHDRSPDFTRDGKHLVFLSDRTFDPHYNAHAFDLAFTGATRPWLIPLSATEPAPFGPSADGWPVSPSRAHGEDETVTCPELDADGAEERIVPFPVPSAEYRDLSCADGGVLWVEVHREQGALGSRRAGVKEEPTPDSLERWSFEAREVETIVDAVDRYAVSGDGQRVIVRRKDDVTVVPATRPAKDDAVKVDLGRLRFSVDPRAEWRQMFDENARLMRDHFWRADMDGVDWDGVVRRWRPVIDAAVTHDDVVDILWETVGELNTSHAYVTPAAPLGTPSRRLGFLGADLSPADGGWRIDRILPGESSEPKARSPLRQAGVGA